MSEDLGRVIGKMEGRLEAMAKQSDAMAKQSDEATQSRKMIHEKLNSMDDKISHMDRRLTELEPIVGEFSKWRERGIGVFLFLSIVLASFGAALALAWERFLHVLGIK